jgi:DNA-binding transcriptional LysR family regulator
MAVNPPRPAVPPLNALRAFEAAARLGGFTLAAAELNVTPGAVAQHIKFLESWCGAALFERRAQGVVLTALGQSVVPEFVSAFDAISSASQLLRKRAAPLFVSIAALPSIAQLLLTEWLPVVRAEMPGLRVSVTALEVAPNLRREPYDLTLFIESNASGGILLGGPDVLLPVCAPQFAAQLGCYQDLAEAPHISDQFWPRDWRRWWEEVVGGEYTGTGPSYSLYSMAVAEALSGAGVLMGHRSLVQPLLARGELVAPFEQSVKIESALVLRQKSGGGGGPVAQITGIFMRLAGNGENVSG